MFGEDAIGDTPATPPSASLVQWLLLAQGGRSQIVDVSAAKRL